MSSCELAIRGGTVVTHERAWRADVGVDGERISVIDEAVRGEREIDASGRFVLPGGIDMHVHLTAQRGLGWRWVDDWRTATAAAAAGGITMIANMSTPDEDEPLVRALERIELDADGKAIVDFTQHAQVFDATPEMVREIADLPGEGYTSIKTFTSFGKVFDELHMAAIAQAGRAGLVTLVHCEDAEILTACQSCLLADERGDIAHYPDSRPPAAEAVATAKTIALTAALDAPLYIVHISCAQALRHAREARHSGQPVWVETRPPYLMLTRERYREPEGARYVSFPPLRDASDQDAVWDSLIAGDIDTYCSDHAPLDRQQILDPGLNVATFKGAFPGLETHMPLLWWKGVRTGRMKLERFVEVTSTNAARLFGYYPTKGTIAVGSDADIVVWDPERSRTIDPAEMQSRADFDVYEGWKIVGWPAATLSRGTVVFEGGDVIGTPGHGRRVRGRASARREPLTMRHRGRLSE